MGGFAEQRRERRLNYDWPIRFAEGFGQTLLQGRMVDISSRGGSFTCLADKDCPHPGQEITTLFSVPRFGSTGSFDMANYNRRGRVCRVDAVDAVCRRVAIQFTEPLFFKPGEQEINESEAKHRLKAVALSANQSY